jgi:hypothetical protein
LGAIGERASIQTEILHLLSASRDPESYVAGASLLNRDAPRVSDDIDVFHDREERVAEAALTDARTCLANNLARCRVPIRTRAASISTVAPSPSPSSVP